MIDCKCKGYHCYYNIIDYQYICTGNIVSTYITNHNDFKLTNKLIRGLNNINFIQLADKFTFIDYFKVSKYDAYGYFVVENNLGAFIVRQDNIKLVKDSLYFALDKGIKRVIRSGDVTTVVYQDGKKYSTKKAPEDKDDQEKAIMMCLLKRYGISVKHLEALLNMLNNTV